MSGDGARLLGVREALQRGSEVGGAAGHTVLARRLLCAHRLAQLARKQLGLGDELALEQQQALAEVGA